MALFGKAFKKSKDDVNKEYDDALALLNSDELQNNKMTGELAQQVLSGLDCDVLPAAVGEFGRCSTNPVPCNGPIGEWTYLSKLRLLSTGDKVFFHKLGSVDGRVDVFELVSTSGQFVDHLYLDMYHPRKSRFSPAGYIQEFELVQPRGILHTCSDFPAGLFKLIVDECEQMLGLKAGDKTAKNINLVLAKESLKDYNGRHQVW